MEEGIQQVREHQPGTGHHGQADDKAAEKGQGVQSGADLIDRVPPPRTDFPTDDNGGGTGNGEDDDGAKVLHIARQGPGCQNLRGALHMAHDHLVHGRADAPQGFIEDHRAGVANEFLNQDLTGPYHQRRFHAEPPVGQGIADCDDKLQNPGQQRGKGRALYPHGRCAQIAEDKHPVEEGIGHHGTGEDKGAQFGILHGPVCAYINARQAVENIGEAHNAGILGRQGYQLGVVGQQTHKLHREEKHHRREQQGNGPGHIGAQTHNPVDGVRVALAPELADQYR